MLGYERAQSLIESLDNTEAVFVLDDASVKLTNGLGDGENQIQVEIFAK